jgi:polysaccharide export outer membrane protein
MRAADDMRGRAGLPADLPRELTQGVLAEYVIEPGDALIVEAANFNSPVRFANGDQTVKPDGTITLGKYGWVIAAGKTVPELQAEVQSLVESQTEEAPGPIVARLLGWESKVYYVLGEVNSPGAYPYSGRETVLDALVAAGDLTDRANRHNIILSRPSAPDDCRTVLPICYNQIVQLGDTSSNYQIMPGDRLFVASMTFWDDIRQTLCPRRFDTCPGCSRRQVPCYVTLCGKNGPIASRIGLKGSSSTLSPRPMRSPIPRSSIIR